jgi:hypothetical protein
VVMVCNGVHEDSVAQRTVDGSVPYISRSVLMEITFLTLLSHDLYFPRAQGKWKQDWHNNG